MFRTALLLFLALPLAAGAQSRQWGDILFDAPPNWNEGRNDGGTLTLLSDLPGEVCRFCYIYLGVSEPYRGDFTAYARGQVARFVDPEDRDGVEPLGEPSRTMLDGHPVVGVIAREGSDMHVVFAVDLGDRAAFIGFEGYARDEEDTRESLETLGNVVAPWMETLRFRTSAADDLLPAAEPGGLSGIYWGWWQRMMPDLGGGLRIDIEHETYVFYPDGHFYHGTPPTGLAPPDRAAMIAATDPDFGTYREERSTLTLTYADGTVETLDWDRAERGWSDGNVTLQQVTPMEDGSRIAGHTRSLFVSGLGGMDGGAVSSETTTRFAADGTYTGRRFGGAFGNFTGGGGFATSSANDLGGTYEIRDGLLILTDAEGAQSADLIFRHANGDIQIGDLYLEDD